MSSIFYNRPAGGRRPKPYAGGAGVATRTEVGDAAYTIKSWDRVVALTAALTADRTWTLPPASSVPPGYSIRIIDEFGGVGGGDDILVDASGSDTINKTLILPFRFFTRENAAFTFISDGVSNWSVDAQATGDFENLSVTGDASVGNLTVSGDTLTGDIFCGNIDAGDATINGNVLAANLRDSTTTFYDNVDPTKKFAFQASGISASTTRTYAAPNEDGTLITDQNIQQVSPSTPMGYTTGAGGAVTQGTSKATAVTLDKPCGAITTHNANLNALTTVAFTVNNSVITSADAVYAVVRNSASYTVDINNVTTGSFVIRLTNITAGNLAEAVVINFFVLNVTAA